MRKSYSNPTTGELIDRSAGGTLGPITLQSGRQIGSATTELLGFAAGALSAMATVTGYLDYLDPLTYLFHSSDAGAGSDVVPGAAANGGFLLYPNKPNMNMMQSVYRK